MKKNNKKFQAPKRSGLTYLILIGSLIVVLLAVFFPMSYIKEYNDNKVIPFAEDLNIHVGHEHEGEDEEPVEYKKVSLSEITDFNLVISCTEYKDGVSATFEYCAYKNENSKTKNPKNMKIKLAMCSNWIGLNQMSSSRSYTIKDDEKSATKSTITLNSLPDLPKKGNLPFINIETVNLYILLTYDTTTNGKTTSHTYLITMPYSEYIVGAVGGIEK